MSKHVLELKDITMQFGGVIAINDLALHVDEGEIVALIGPNGAGKTTAFNCITGVYEPTNGQILFNDKLIVENYPHGKMKKQYLGHDEGKYIHVVNPSPDKITNMGIARTFQNIRLFSSLSVFDNVLTAQHLHIKSGFLAATLRLNAAEERRMREKTMNLLEVVGLADYSDEVSGSLPYGLQRRLEIGRALATNPSLLLLDEPAAGMNPQETEDLDVFIRDIRSDFNLTILMIEHHMNLVMDISDRIYVIDFGSLIANGTPSEIQNDQKVIDAYLGVSDDE